MIQIIIRLLIKVRQIQKNNLSIIPMRDRFKTIPFFILSVFAWHPAMAADCHQQSITSLTHDLGTISVPYDLPVGSAITGDLNFSDNAFFAMCESTDTLSKAFSGELIGSSSVAGTFDGRTTFSTSIPGVGIQLGGVFPVTSNKGYNQTYSLWLQNGATSETAFTISDIGWGEQFDIHYSPGFRLVKTSDSLTGGTFSGVVGTARASGNQGSASLSINVTGNITVTTPACTILTPSVNTNLNNHLTTEFTGVNSSTASEPVTVQLNCPKSGMKVMATVNATPDTSTALPGAIKLSAGSGLTAGGVAVQMLDAGSNGLPLNSPVQYETVSAGIFDFGWKARYLQTGTTVTAGEASASATVSLTYQ